MVGTRQIIQEVLTDLSTDLETPAGYSLGIDHEYVENVS